MNAAIQAYKANKALVMNTPLNRQPQVVEAADATKEAWLALKRTDIKSPVTLLYCSEKRSGRRNSESRTIVNGCRTGTSNVG